MSTSIRTIWISIRAMNYSINVINDLIRQLTLTQTTMGGMAIASLNMAKAAFSAGILFGVLGSQIGGTYGQMLIYASYLMYAIAAIQAVSAAMKILNTVTMEGAVTMAIYLAPIITAVTLFYVLQNVLGTIPALIVAIVAACAAFIASLIIINALTGGALAAGGGMFGGILSAIGAAPTMFSAQTGTRMVPYTGIGMLHKGEIVYNPMSGRPTQIGNDLAGGGGSVTTIDASVNVEGDLNTKADAEDLQDVMKKQSRTIAQNNR